MADLWAFTHWADKGELCVCLCEGETSTLNFVIGEFPLWLFGNEPNYYAWGCRFDPWPHSVCWRSWVTMSFGVGHRQGWILHCCVCGYDLTPSLGTSIYHGCPKKKKKQTKNFVIEVPMWHTSIYKIQIS